MPGIVPRLVLAGVQSGVGKTTVACALLAAFRRRGLTVAPFKAGPDYIDPTYHTQAAGRPCRNLDTWLLSPPAVRELFHRAAAQAAVAVVEGVMGLYDGRTGGATGEGEEEGSTAHLAKLLDAPVVLLVNAAGTSRTAAAVVLGMQRFDPAVRLAGVVLSGIASERHLELVKGPIERTTGLRVLGFLPKRPEFALPARHLGLVPAAEHGVDAAFFDRLAIQAEATLDLNGLLTIAREAPPLFPVAPPLCREAPHLSVQEHPPAALFPVAPAPTQARIALALDDAFHFYYQDGLDLLRAHGAELVPFSPLRDHALPEGTQGVYLGGGFPEVFASQLAANRSMLAALNRVVAAGLPVYAECGGLMYVGRGIVDQHGGRHAMAGLFPYWSTMGQSRVTLGYRVATARRRTLLLPSQAAVRGHEFHWSVLEQNTLLPGPERDPAYDLTTADGRSAGSEGFVGGPRGNVLASYVHLHLATDPRLAPAFVAACAPHAGRAAYASTGMSTSNQRRP